VWKHLGAVLEVGGPAALHQLHKLLRYPGAKPATKQDPITYSFNAQCPTAGMALGTCASGALPAFRMDKFISKVTALVDMAGRPLRARIVKRCPPRRLNRVDLPEWLAPAEQLIADHRIGVHILQRKWSDMSCSSAWSTRSGNQSLRCHHTSYSDPCAHAGACSRLWKAQPGICTGQRHVMCSSHAGKADMSHHFAVVRLMPEDLRRHVPVAASLARHVVPPAGCPLQAEPHAAAPAVAVAAPVLALHGPTCEAWVSCFIRWRTARDTENMNFVRQQPNWAYEIRTSRCAMPDGPG
jgi:hypothetical protein